jgi:hypothetical protein
MNFVSCAETRHLPGLRLVLAAGAPGPWSEAAKAILALHAIPLCRRLACHAGR